MPEGADVKLEASFESVTEGIWVHGSVAAQAVGECSRCLDEVRIDIAPDIQRSMWSKFLFIAPMSTIGALTRGPIGVWRSIPESREIAVRALREMVAVAAARGVDLGADAVDRTLERYDAMSPESTSSLQRDIMVGKPSELDAQAGAIVRMGRDAGVPTPVCESRSHRGVAG